MAETIAATGPKAKSKLPLILVTAVTVIALGVGGWMWQRSKSRGSKAADPPPVAEVKSVLHLESFVVNLQGTGDNGYLRVGIDLGLTSEAKESDKEAQAAYLPHLRDTILSVLGTRTVDELLTPEGKTKLKADLLPAITQAVPQLQCKEVYFTEFLVQH